MAFEVNYLNLIGKLDDSKGSALCAVGRLLQLGGVQVAACFFFPSLGCLALQKTCAKEETWGIFWGSCNYNAPIS